MHIKNPATGALLQDVHDDSIVSVRGKVERAAGASQAWRDVPLSTRMAMLRKFRVLVEERADDLSRALTAEIGKPITQARREIAGVGERLEFFLDHVPGVLEDEVVWDDGSMEERVSRDPLGVVACISAWNYPWSVGTNLFVPALLVGNTVVYKPSEFSTLTGLAIGRLLAEAGIPDDVFSVVVGPGAVGAAILDQAIDGVFFTGSYNTGRRIAERVAGRLVPVVLELGGKDPVYVCEDVDLQHAAATLAEGAFCNAGQSGSSVERLYVHSSIYEPFVRTFAELVKGFVVGDPNEESTYIGPIVRENHLAVLERQAGDAVAKGARLLCGGKRIDRPGHWFEPTVLADVDHRMEVMIEESFGPILGIQAVSGDGEAIELMNDSDYGLTAGVFTRDRERARRILSRVNAGTAYWNACDRVSPRLPWGGRGHSGVGVTLGVEGIEAFTRAKAWQLRAP